MAKAESPTPQWINAKKTAEMCGVTTRTLHNWIAAGRFPKPCLVGSEERPHRRWILHEVVAFMKARRQA